MLSFPLILTIVFLMAGALLVVILLVVLLPRTDRDGARGPGPWPPEEWAGPDDWREGRNGEGITPVPPPQWPRT